jgi:hypothetical protein
MTRRRDWVRMTTRIGLLVAWLGLGGAPAACGGDDTGGGPPISIAGAVSTPGGTGGPVSTIPSGSDGGTPGAGAALGDGGAPGAAAGPGDGGAPGAGAAPGDVGTPGAAAGSSDGGEENNAAGHGAGGSAGSLDQGGSAGLAGSGGEPALLPGTGVGSIGRACSRPSDCAVGLACVTQNDLLLDGAAPPHGFCSRPCTSNAECHEHSPGALCFSFGSDESASYCVEGCSFGSPENGKAKCHGRGDFACDPALLEPTTASCGSTDQCEPGEICVDGVCNVVFPGCLPSCRGDLDCASGLYCDQAFLSGTCTPQKPTGKRLGEPCTMPSAQEPDEPDECLGFCQADSAGGGSAHCAASCVLGSECAWDAGSGKFDGACLYRTLLTSNNAVDAGDFGFCTPTCSCSDGCSKAGVVCSVLDGSGPLSDAFSGPGLCFSEDASTNYLCGAGGAGAP